MNHGGGGANGGSGGGTLGSGQFGHVFRCRLDGEAGQLHAVKRVDRIKAELGLYPIATPQYSATPLYQVSCHIQELFVLK